MADVKPIPDGYPTVTPYLCVDGAADAIRFYTSVLGASERMRIGGPGDRVGHAELALGDSVIMLADEWPEMGIRGPRSIGGSPVTLSIYVEDVDATVESALAAGARATQPVENRFYGDRVGQIEDPFGHLWSIATHVEDVPPEEIGRRAAVQMAGGSSG